MRSAVPSLAIALGLLAAALAVVPAADAASCVNIGHPDGKLCPRYPQRYAGSIDKSSNGLLPCVNAPSTVKLPLNMGSVEGPGRGCNAYRVEAEYGVDVATLFFDADGEACFFVAYTDGLCAAF